LNVTVYSTTTCPYCKMLKDYLTQKNVNFQEKLVDQDLEAQKEMLELSGGFLGVPFTLLIKSDGSKETIIGFDKGRFDNVLS